MKQRSAGKPDIELGKRIRLRRVEQKISQAELGEKLGVSFQQVQKYETGKNRVGAGRLQAIAERLGVPVSSFFEPEPEVAGDSGPALLRVSGAVELLRAYNQIADDHMRRDVLSLVKSAARVGQSRAAEEAPSRQSDRGDAAKGA
jgi:transcriptional regulator with XRE-family HTH domain